MAGRASVIPSTSIAGLVACSIVTVGVVLTVLGARRFSPKVRLPLLVALFAVTLVPVDGMLVCGYVRGLLGDPSVTLVVLASCGALAETRGRDVFDDRNLRLTMITIVLAGAILYPSALGLTAFDTYALGYGAPLLSGAVFVVALVAWFRDLYMLLLCVVLGVLAFMIGVYESPNLWDYLVDPLALVIALVWNAGRWAGKWAPQPREARHEETA
jgi:hypothetical protein